MAFDLSGKVALITGAGQGMGAEIARVFSAHGATVAVCNRTFDLAENVAREIVDKGGRAAAFPYAVGGLSDTETFVSGVAERFGRLDILVHNAGFCPWQDLENMSEEGLESTLDVNLKACFWLTRAAIPLMRNGGQGRVLVTSSVTGPRVAAWGASHYAASKAGVNGFIRSAALELAADRITVNGVEPGFIAKPGRGVIGQDGIAREISRYIPAGGMGSGEDVAYAMLFLASDEARYITGQTIVVDGGAGLPENPVFMNRRSG